MIARDRATAYADGARQGALAATQVADRWHRLRNVAEAWAQVFHQHRSIVQARPVPSPERSLARVDQPAGIEAPALTAEPAALVSPSAEASPRHAHRRQRSEQVCDLARQGWTFQAIAQQVGLQRKTVAQYVRADSYPARARPRSGLDPYKPYVLDCWNRGGRTGMRLYEDIQRQGYRGGRSTVRGYFTQLRKAQGLAPRTRTMPPTPPVTDPTVQGVTPRQATWLTLRRPPDLTEDAQHLLTQLHHAHAAFAQAIALAHDFARLLRARQPAQLDAWLQQVATSSLVALRRLAQSLQRDYGAIQAGLTLSWSSGPVEGHMNRLKMRKRHMYGRARLDLWRRRFVLAPQPGQGQAPGQPIPAQAPQEAAAA